MFLGLAGEIETLTKTSTLIPSYLSVSTDRLFLSLQRFTDVLIRVNWFSQTRLYFKIQNKVERKCSVW